MIVACALEAITLLGPSAGAITARTPPLSSSEPGARRARPATLQRRAGMASEEALERYVERIPHTEIELEMLPIPGGSFLMGSREDERGRFDDEGPRHPVVVEPFWMSSREITWNLYRRYMLGLDRELPRPEGLSLDAAVDAVSRPTAPYVPMDFGMGVDGFPAVSMTQFAARHFTKWLSAITGRSYRLPSEAEWEYACRAGTETAYSFGDDLAALDRHAWHRGNSPDGYQRPGELQPNPWGLFDMHGNAAEWTLDAYSETFYGEVVARLAIGEAASSPVNWPQTEYPRVARGGSFQNDADRLRCAARQASSGAWKMSDPQFPQSIWYLTDARFVGLRVVRPVRPPSEGERRRAWEPDTDSVRRIFERQRRRE